MSFAPYEEPDMNSSFLEKRALRRFLAVYFAAISLTVIGFATLLYDMELKNLQERLAAKLHAQATTIAFRAIDAQMMHKSFFIDPHVSYRLHDSDGHLIRGNFRENVSSKAGFFIQNECAYYVSKAARSHLGIDTIIVRDCSYGEKKREILQKNILIASLSFIVLLGVGWYLGRLFLEPMKRGIEELDRFIKDSTHELNTPVTAMMLALSKIKEESRYAKIAKMSALRISKIYEDLTYLNFGGETSKEPVSIDNVVEELLDLFALTIEQKQLQIEKRLSPCTITANKKEMELLVKNLIDNAVKYAPPHSPVTISLQDCSLQISNRINTKAPKDLQAIFERYKRADSSTGGFGIGLNIVKTICQKYDFSYKAMIRDAIITLRIDCKGNKCTH